MAELLSDGSEPVSRHYTGLISGVLLVIVGVVSVAYTLTVAGCALAILGGVTATLAMLNMYKSKSRAAESE